MNKVPKKSQRLWKFKGRNLPSPEFRATAGRRSLANAHASQQLTTERCPLGNANVDGQARGYQCLISLSAPQVCGEEWISMNGLWLSAHNEKHDDDNSGRRVARHADQRGSASGIDWTL